MIPAWLVAVAKNEIPEEKILHAGSRHRPQKQSKCGPEYITGLWKGNPEDGDSSDDQKVLSDPPVPEVFHPP